MSNLFGQRVAIVSYRLGMADGVSVTAAQWATAFRRLGMRVRLVAGDGRPDVLVPGLALEAAEPPSRRSLDQALQDADVVVADNVCSLPVNQAAGEAVAEYLRGRPAVLRHHDLPWERERYADVTTWPPDDPAWRHVTVNELARRSLLEKRGIVASTVYHGFDERPCPQRRDEVRRLLGVEGELAAGLGLENEWVVNVIQAVGNYGEIYDRNLGPNTPFALERGPNQLWTEGGLLYAPPYR